MNLNKLKIRAFLALISVAVLFLLYFLVYIFSPVDKGGAVTTIEIKKGLSFRQVNAILAEAGLVRHPLLFHLLALGNRATERIKAGEYELSQTLSPRDILQKLVRGEVKAFMIAVLEDSTLRDLLERLVSPRLVDPAEFLRLAHDPDFLRSLGIEGISVEGYLFPDTYRLDRTMGAEQIIRIMVGEFWKSFTPEMQRQLPHLGFTLTEIVTLASLIGKEAGHSQEKPYVSAVFHNRLKKGMKLQSDPTAVYNLENFSGKIRRRHLRIDTPHNTYLIDALPPTPIGNPGLDSLKAALYPAQVNYLYFVSKNDGTHQFSATFPDHRRAVIKYQVNRGKD